jgi:hypothetical protein
MPRDDTPERITRMERLNDRLSAELDTVREEGRVVAHSLKEHAAVQQGRAGAARRSADEAKTRAVARQARTQRLTRRKTR